MKKYVYILFSIITALYIYGEEKLPRIFIPDFKLIELTNIPDQYKKDFSISKPLHMELTEKTINTVDNFGKFEIVTPEEVDEIFEELNLTKEKTDIDEAGLIKIGKLANAEYLLLGSLTRGTFSSTINLKLVELITGKYIYSASISQVLKKRMFEEIENVISLISSVDYNIEKYQNSRNKIIILNLEPVNVKRKTAELATRLLGASFITYRKYWQIKQTELDNGLKQLNLINAGTIDLKKAAELGNITNSRLIILGEIKQPAEKITVSIHVMDVRSGEIIYDNNIETTSKNEIPEIMDRFAKLISDKKSIEETDKTTISFDLENARKAKNTGTGMLSAGLTLTALGLCSTITGIVRFSIYPSRLQDISGINKSRQAEYSGITTNILAAAVINLPIGIILLVPGLIISFMSIKHFISAKKYEDRSKLSLMPDLVISRDKICLDFNIKL